MIKAIIFDLDGTLANTIPEIREGVNMTMEKLGHPTHSPESILSFINNGARHLIRCALPCELQGDEAAVDHALAQFNQCYGETYMNTKTTYDGVRELVEKLHGAYKIGVLSNKQDPFVKNLSRQLLGEEYCDAAQGVIAGMPPKPHPYHTEKIAAELGVSTEECVMIGDSDIDLLTAQNANMKHIGVTWGFRSEEFLREKGVKNLAHTADELEALIHQLAEEE